MIYKLIISYLLGVIIEVNFGTDRYFLSLSFILSFIIYLTYKHYKRQINSPNIIYSLMSFIVVFSIFSVSTIYTKRELKQVSYQPLEGNTYNIDGTVVDMKQSNNVTQITLQVDNLKNLNTNHEESDFPRYIDVTVSLLNKYNLCDKLSVVGEINFENWQVAYEELPLFFSYQQEKLFYNSNFNVTHPKNISVIGNTKNIFETLVSLLHNFGETLNQKISDYMSEPYASIAEGISLGNQENILKDIKDIFRKSGLIHILVLSGANVTFIISIVWYFLRTTKNKYKIILATFFTWIFIFLTGLTPPSVRAGVMSSTNILSEYFGKNLSQINSLLLSLFVLTILNPLTLVYSPSLHLSFLACVGIFILAPKIENYLQKILHKKFKFLKFLFANFFGIFLTTTPYILALVGTSSLFGTILTFLVEPFVLITTIFSFLIIFSSFINFYLAEFFGILNTISTKIILSVASFGANNLPLINFQISKSELLIYYSFLFLVVVYISRPAPVVPANN